MTQEMTQKCINNASPMDCLEIESTMLEEHILKGEITLKPIQARKKRAILRALGKISRLFKNRSEIASLTRKSKLNPHFSPEKVPVERIKRCVYDNTPRMY